MSYSYGAVPYVMAGVAFFIAAVLGHLPAPIATLWARMLRIHKDVPWYFNGAPQHDAHSMPKNSYQNERPLPFPLQTQHSRICRHGVCSEKTSQLVYYARFRRKLFSSATL
jgi:hypothetical protein